jgi:hypothetical protein
LATKSGPLHSGDAAKPLSMTNLLTLLDLLHGESTLPGCFRWDLRDDATRDRDCRAGELSAQNSHSPCGALTADMRECEASAVKAT